MKKIILSLVAAAMSGTIAFAQTNSITSGNMPTSSGFGYAYEFNGTGAENCNTTHVPAFIATGYALTIDETNHSLDISTDGTQGGGVKLAFYEGNCDGVSIDLSDNANQKITLQVVSDVVIPQLIVLFYDVSGAASDHDPIVLANVPADTTIYTIDNPAQIVFKSWSATTGNPLDSTQINGVGFMIRNAYNDWDLEANVSIPYIHIGDAPEVTSARTQKVNNSLLSVYPNPAKDQINLDLSSMGASNASVKIMNANGMVVYEGSVSGTTEAINTSSFNKGIYVVQVSNETQVSNKKIVIE